MAIDIQEGNKLIADFLGWKQREYPPLGTLITVPNFYPVDLTYNNGSTEIEPKFIDFHTRWDYLIPVVQKIERVGMIVQITFCLCGSCHIWNHKGIRFQTEKNNPILAVYNAVIMFINWHNQQKDEL